MPQSRTDLYNQIDTCIVGYNALITRSREVFGMPKFVNAVAYNPTLGSVSNIPVINAAVAYKCPHSGEIIVLKINQAIHIDTMSNNLICKVQLRMNEGKLFECPKYLADNPSEFDHTIFVTPVANVDNNFIIILSLYGFTSYFPTIKPTIQEYDLAEREGISYDLIYDSLEWDPYMDSFLTKRLQLRKNWKWK